MSIAPNPAAGLAPDVAPAAFNGMGGSMAMAIWFDDRIFDRAKQIAGYLAKAQGFVPAHLLGKPEACFAIVERSLTWKLSPYAVAQSTYQTPGGKVGFEGKLCQAILENSGRLVGGVKYEFFYNVVLKVGDKLLTMRSSDPDCKVAIRDGAEIIEKRDWSRVQGKFAKKTSSKGNEYAAPDWKPEHEIGLGVLVRAQIIGEAEPREFEFELVQAFPRNSTLWATDPKTQICYLAVRRFASVAAPGIFMGVPFDGGDEDMAFARDVTPAKPTRSDFDAGPKPTVTDVATTPEEEAAADRAAAEFARTGGQPEQEDAATDEPHDPVTGEIQGDKTEAEPVEFWKRESLEIVPTPVGRSFDWSVWQKEITQRIAEAASIADIDALAQWNDEHITSLSAKYVRNGDEVKTAFAKRRAALDGVEG